MSDPSPLNVESAVRERYSEAAASHEACLCTPIDYDPKLLEVIPREVIERDYGCGDPSKHIREGETVLDLGSGGGKICFIAAQVVGPTGKVIGVDMNPDMLALARRAAPEVAEKLGYANVEFRRGRIQDLKLNLDRLEEFLRKRPVADSDAYLQIESLAEDLRAGEPLIEDGSVDAIVSNCVLNLVRPADKAKLFREMYRVLRDGPDTGGRVVISDIVGDEDVPIELQNDPNLWSGCISGAYREDLFLKAFEDAGFHGVRILERQDEPWAAVEGIEFRSITVEAFKGKAGPCLERNQAVIYTGPWKQVVDDDGHVLRRGERMAVCDKTYRVYTRPSGPYAGQVIGVEPREPVAPGPAGEFDCTRSRNRHPRETKGMDFDLTDLPKGECCGPDGCC